MEKKMNTIDEFFKALDNFNDFLEHPESVIVDHNHDTESYTVVITGLNYVDAQNIVEMGLEYGKTVNFSVEGDDEDGNN